MSRPFIIGSLAVLMILLVVLSQALQPVKKPTSADFQKKMEEATGNHPAKAAEMMANEKAKRMKFEEIKKKYPQPEEPSSKDDWYNQMTPGSQGIKQLEKEGKK
jgi:hypothetical protein